MYQTVSLVYEADGSVTITSTKTGLSFTTFNFLELLAHLSITKAKIISIVYHINLVG